MRECKGNWFKIPNLKSPFFTFNYLFSQLLQVSDVLGLQDMFICRYIYLPAIYIYIYIYIFNQQFKVFGDLELL